MTAAAARFDGILWQIVSRSAAFIDDYVYSREPVTENNHRMVKTTLQ